MNDAKHFPGDPPLPPVGTPVQFFPWRESLPFPAVIGRHSSTRDMVWIVAFTPYDQKAAHLKTHFLAPGSPKPPHWHDWCRLVPPYTMPNHLSPTPGDLHVLVK